MSDKLAVITGASGGIGACIARTAHRNGYRVALLDVQAQALERVAAELDGAQVHMCDITDADAVEATLDDLGAVPDLLVNNAGIVRFAPILDVSVADFRRVVDIDLTGAFIMSQAVARRMRDTGRTGSIVNISSIGGITPSPGTNAYSASKAALANLSELMAIELGPLGIRVNTVSPGFIDGGMTAGLYSDPNVRASRSGGVPLRRLGTEQDVADAVLFLASDAAGYVSGHNLVVDGAVTHSVLSHI